MSYLFLVKTAIKMYKFRTFQPIIMCHRVFTFLILCVWKMQQVIKPKISKSGIVWLLTVFRFKLYFCLDYHWNVILSLGFNVKGVNNLLHYHKIFLITNLLQSIVAPTSISRTIVKPMNENINTWKQFPWNSKIFSANRKKGNCSIYG